MSDEGWRGGRGVVPDPAARELLGGPVAAHMRSKQRPGVGSQDIYDVGRYLNLAEGGASLIKGRRYIRLNGNVIWISVIWIPTQNTSLRRGEHYGEGDGGRRTTAGFEGFQRKRRRCVHGRFADRSG